MITEGSQRFRARYRQVGELGHTAFRSAQRSATGLSGSLRPPTLSTGGKLGGRPANSRRRLRTWPKVRPGSSLCTSPKTSPLASLVGSHHPRPAWLTIRISPLPRRYFRLSLVLSFRSSFHGGGVRSSTTAQCTLSRRSSISGSCPVMSAPRVLSAGAGLNGLGLVFAPALPADREAVALQGRAERAGACDAPFAARTAPAVVIPLSFTSHAKPQRRRREQEIGPMPRGSTQSGRQEASGYDSRRDASRNIRGTAEDATRRKRLPRRGAPGF